MIIGRIIENLKKVESKNGPRFVTVIFVVEKDATACFILKLRELVKTDTRFE